MRDFTDAVAVVAIVAEDAWQGARRWLGHEVEVVTLDIEQRRVFTASFKRGWLIVWSAAFAWWIFA